MMANCIGCCKVRCKLHSFVRSELPMIKFQDKIRLGATYFGYFIMLKV